MQANQGMNSASNFQGFDLNSFGAGTSDSKNNNDQTFPQLPKTQGLNARKYAPGYSLHNAGKEFYFHNQATPASSHNDNTIYSKYHNAEKSAIPTCTEKIFTSAHNKKVLQIMAKRLKEGGGKALDNPRQIAINNIERQKVGRQRHTQMQNIQNDGDTYSAYVDNLPRSQSTMAMVDGDPSSSLPMAQNQKSFPGEDDQWYPKTVQWRYKSKQTERVQAISSMLSTYAESLSGLPPFLQKLQSPFKEDKQKVNLPKVVQRELSPLFQNNKSRDIQLTRSYESNKLKNQAKNMQNTGQDSQQRLSKMSQMRTQTTFLPLKNGKRSERKPDQRANNDSKCQLEYVLAPRNDNDDITQLDKSVRGANMTHNTSHGAKNKKNAARLNHSHQQQLSNSKLSRKSQKVEQKTADKARAAADNSNERSQLDKASNGPSNRSPSLLDRSTPFSRMPKQLRSKLSKTEKKSNPSPDLKSSEINFNILNNSSCDNPKPEEEAKMRETILFDTTDSEIIAKALERFKYDTEPQSTKEILTDALNKHRIIREKQRMLDERVMKGRSHFAQPNKKNLKRISDSFINLDQEEMLKKLTGNERSKQGIVTLKTMYSKQKQKDQKEHKEDKLTDYVTHFSEIAEIYENMGLKETSSVVANKNLSTFASAIKEKVEINRVKGILSNAIKQNMERRRSQKNGEKDSPEPTQREIAFNKTLEEETKQMSFIADKLVKKKEYQQKFKDIQKYSDQEDPRIQFYSKCHNMQNVVLPILDKIWKKTLCLQDYFLSEGNISGLANACEVLDHRIVNRILLSNNGINGDQLAQIISGMAKLREFKSLIYKQNSLNQNALAALRPVFQKRLPLQMEELKLIDCKISPKLTIELMENLLRLSQLKRFSLIGGTHTEQSFERIVMYIEQSQSVQEIDLSHSIVPKGSWVKLTNVLRENRTLRNLQIGFNKLLEDQSWGIRGKRYNSYQELEDEQKSTGGGKPDKGSLIANSLKAYSPTDVPLSPSNQDFMDGLTAFIKYNPMVFHIDLQSAGLPAQIIRQIGHLLTRSPSLQAIHLSGNEGIDFLMIEWLRRRIRAADDMQVNNIVPHEKKLSVDVQNKAVSQPRQSNALSMLGLLKKPTSQQDPNREWKELRAGLKLQSIVKSKRMNEISHTSLLDKRKCVITRHLGYQKLIPNSAIWQIFTEEKDECWFCGQHVLSLFLWSPRIGQLSQIKDSQVRKHYQDQFSALEAEDDFMPVFYQTPHFRSYFTNWRVQPMREVLEFCRQHDQNPPDPVPQLIMDQTLDPKNADPKYIRTEHEKRIISAELDYYYEANWTHVIISIFQQKNPVVANAHLLSSLSSKVDQTSQIFFDIGWVRPGRHVFVVEHDQGGAILDDDDVYCNRLQNFMESKMRQGAKNRDQRFYVHEMLAGLRNDEVPLAFKEKNIRKVERAMYKPKPVFERWKKDDPDSIRRCFDNDFKLIPTIEITNGSREDLQTLLLAVSLKYSHLKEIFHYLQGQSTQYPRIDRKTLKEQFIQKLKIDSSAINYNKIEVLMQQIHTVNHNLQKEEQKKDKDANNSRPLQGFNRYMILELLLRLAKFLYCEDNNEQEKALKTSLQWKGNDYITCTQAFGIFYDNQIDHYLNSNDINWSSFRDHHLSNHNVELVFTMNMPAIEILYKKYAQELQGSKKKEELMTVNDCLKLLKDESLLKVPKEPIKQAFALSKMTVENESGSDGVKQYKTINRVEFLEFLSRIADLFFQDSEMEDLQLYEKIEHLLDELLPLVGATRIKQQITVDEFSESDDDY